MLQQITTHNNVLLSVWDNQAFDRQPMIFLHGLTGNHLQLQFYVHHFSDRYRTIALDFRGRGNSGLPENQSSLNEHAKDVIDLIHTLDLKNPILVGYSMGAFVASLVAIEVPVKGLVLLDGAATLDDHQDKIVSPTFGRLSNCYASKGNYIDLVSSNYAKMGVTKSNELINVLTYEIFEKSDGWYNKALEETIRQDWKSFYDYDIRKIGPRINVPTLLVQALGSIGTNEALFMDKHYDATKTSIYGLEVKLTDANHYTLVFEPREDVVEFIDRFLKKRV